MNTPDDNKTAKNYEINTVLKHELYEQNQKHDIALVFTKQNIEFNDRTKPACIPQEPEDFEDSVDSLVKLIGWGLEDEFPDRVNDSLKDASIQVFSERICQEHYANFDPDIHLCAGHEVSFKTL